MDPRPYQLEALDALDEHIRTKTNNPCVVIPTGGGKSIIMAWAIQRWKRDYNQFRVCILAHRKELVEQNSIEFKDLITRDARDMHELGVLGDVGVYAAGLGIRDLDNSITFASIDSIYNKWGEFPPFDCLVVDEAHRIPAAGEGKYRDFIKGCRSQNPNLRVIGFTATPFRMGCGMICHRDHILNEVCYTANVGDLISHGFLCRLRSKVGDVQPDMEMVKRNSKGDYVVKSLAEAVDRPKLIQDTMRSVMGICQAENRKSIVFFCVDIKHCHDVSMELRKYGLTAPVVTGKTKGSERDRIAKMFKAGQYRAICNVNVYTEGFNAKRVDCIVLLRPTLSAALYLQMVGRGLRLHEDKENCLVLDYAHCIETHGPIDCIEDEEVKVIACGECDDTFSRSVRICPNCGWVIPKQEVERAEAEEREKKMHEAEVARLNILGSEPEELTVDEVTVHRHKKMGKPDSIRVQYRCGITTIKEWVCLDHGGLAEDIANKWWEKRFGTGSSNGLTVDSAMHLFLAAELSAITESITVRRKGKNTEIVGHKLKKENMILKLMGMQATSEGN